MTDYSKVNIDPTWRGMVRWGGIALVAGGIICGAFVILVFTLGQTLPIPPQEMLEDPTTTARMFQLALLGELLLLPGAFGLYFGLKNNGRTPVLIATALFSFSAVMFWVARGFILALSAMSEYYLAAPSATMQATYLATAELALEVQHIYATMALILLNVASIILGIVMLRSFIGKRLGYVVIVAGIVTIFTPFGVKFMDIPIIIPLLGLVLTTYWQIVVGVKLFKAGGAV